MRNHTSTDRCPPPEWQERHTGEHPDSSTATGSLAVHYLVIVASMADADPMLLGQLCRELELPDSDRRKVLAAAVGGRVAVERHFAAMRSSPFKFTLLSDCMSLAYARRRSAVEREELRALARALEIDDAQVNVLEARYERVEAQRIAISRLDVLSRAARALGRDAIELDTLETSPDSRP